MSSAKTPTPHRQIRAAYDANTITVYQAYSEAIASAAVSEQRLDASPLFSTTRMTWIKPSWCWMLYRAGYSLKDKRQSRILALKLTRSGFEEMLSAAELSHAPDVGVKRPSNAPAPVQEPQNFTEGSIRVQWDPERGPRLEKYPYRSVQIGVSSKWVSKMVREYIVEIEDVTAKALELKELVESNEAAGIEELVEKELMPVEKPYPLPEQIASILAMDV